MTETKNDTTASESKETCSCESRPMSRPHRNTMSVINRLMAGDTVAQAVKRAQRANRIASALDPEIEGTEMPAAKLMILYSDDHPAEDVTDEGVDAFLFLSNVIEMHFERALEASTRTGRKLRSEDR